ncbi:unnamed protein product [Polarella glacialis]|uniref:Calcineurin-like phosphoesterase domain-containing protein n=1 Tax=Polarella glacialis TaxID=89957 RepID=A0A813JJJ5_POLGL|nr:unnamed protein product [Polarella glacialis]
MQRRASKSGESGATRKGSFLVIGDWGWDPHAHGDNVRSSGCQKTIADAMLVKMRELKDVKFIVNVGDSFYPRGVKSKTDHQWDTKWRHMYDPELRSVPWYSVYGNHDYIGDPCACGSGPEECAQINSDISNLDFFYMPDLNWVQAHPELDLEVIGLDLNQYMWAYSNKTTSEYQCPFDCQYTKCDATCERNIKHRAIDGIKLFQERSVNSLAKNLVVFSHYPTDYFFSQPDFIKGLSDNSKHNITYFGGHRHNTDQTSTISTAPNTNWVVGGGGGWSCDGREQGFVVGEISQGGELYTYPVLVDPDACCKPLPHPRIPGFPWWKKCRNL